MDRCALFVDAGYVLADGAMAVHGTRRRESVSWDYEGLLQLLAGLARERSGLPLLRCYWYEGSVEGRRTTDHDALADLPGVKLRLSKTRPGREGVESEIHRDLTALARNQAVSDAMVVSAEEELAQVVADVQDLGMRVTLLHIAVDGNWTISRTLRQESDDIVEISAADLRPFVELIPGAEPAGADEQGGGALIPLRPQANGHLPAGRTAPYAPIPASSGNGHQAPPAIYTAPVVAEYQRSAPQLPRHVPDEPAVSYDRAPHEQAARYEDTPADERDHQQPTPPASQAAKPAQSAQSAQSAQQEIPLHPDQRAAWQDSPPARQDLFAALAERPARRQEAPDARQELTASPQETPPAHGQQVRPELPAARLDQQPARTDVPPAIDPATRPGLSARPGFAPRPDLYGAPVAAPVPAPQDDRPADLPAATRPRLADVSGYNPGAMREPLAGDDSLLPVPVANGSAQIRRLPTRGNGPSAPSTGYPPMRNRRDRIRRDRIRQALSLAPDNLVWGNLAWHSPAWGSRAPDNLDCRRWDSRGTGSPGTGSPPLTLARDSRRGRSRPVRRRTPPPETAPIAVRSQSSHRVRSRDRSAWSVSPAASSASRDRLRPDWVSPDWVSPGRRSPG